MRYVPEKASPGQPRLLLVRDDGDRLWRLVLLAFALTALSGRLDRHNSRPVVTGAERAGRVAVH
jgi:hypothetical protein